MQIMTLIDPIFSALAGFIQKFATAILAMLVGTGSFMAPPTDDPIKAVNPDEVQLTFNVSGDSQVNGFTYNRVYLDLMLQDINNAETEQDAFVVVGDITENCLESEWTMVTNFLGQYNYGKNLILATGNHDIRLRDYEESLGRFTAAYNTVTGEALDSMSYTKEINGYTFIVMGSDEEVMEEAYISDAQLEWLDASLSEATADGKPVFVILHQPLKNSHGLPIPWGNGTNKNAGHVGDQSEEIQAILDEYKNVVLISGHLHLGFGQYTYEKIGNIHAVNVPAIGKGNADGDYNEFSTGYSVEVYDDEVVFRARDYANGKYLPEFDVVIPVE